MDAQAMKARHPWKSRTLQELLCRLEWRSSQTTNALSPAQSGCEQLALHILLPTAFGTDNLSCFVSRARRTSRVTAQHTNTCLIHRTTKWMRWEGASWLFSLYFQMNFAPLSLCPTLQVGKGGNEFLLHLLIFRLNHPHASHTLNPASSWHVFQLKQKKKQNHQQKKYTKPKLPYQQLQIQPFGKIRIKNASKSSHLWLNSEV